MSINFISKINKSENKKIIWFILIVGFLLSIYSIIDLFILFPSWVAFGLIGFSTIFYVLWSFLPYIVFTIIAFKTKGKRLLIITGLIVLLVDIYFHYIEYISTSVGSSLTLFFSPIILIVGIFVLIGIGKLLKFNR